MATKRIFGGSFDFESVVTNLFSKDLGWKSQLRNAENISDQNLMFAYDIAKNAGKGINSFPWRRLSDRISKNADATLFHERIHYWQMISCPLQQHRYLVYLDTIRMNLIKVGEDPYTLCGEDDGFLDLSLNEEMVNSAEANFKQYDLTLSIKDTANKISLPEAFKNIQIKGVDWIKSKTTGYEEIPFAQLFLLLPHSSRKSLPAYGALMHFKDHDKYVIIPFTALYLMESVAHLSQLLYERKSLPKITQLDNHDDKLYFGVFEYWRRLHGYAYNNEEDLILSFLAAVDLALTSDIYEIEPSDGEYEYEMSSIPYRFGKLAFRIQGIEPLKCETENERADAVAKFQDRICKWNGWPKPDFAVKRMAAALSRFLFKAHAKSSPYTKENEEYVIKVWRSSLSELAEHFDVLLPLWKLYQNKMTTAFGQSILGNMLNACLYRINNPGEFALPHLYHNKIKEHFPLPLVLFKGDYYLDNVLAENTVRPGYPYPITSMQTALEIISMMTLKPITAGRIDSCGFLDEGIDCWYIKSGLGCPLRGFTSNQEKLRDKTGLHNWCHFTFQRSIITPNSKGP